MKNSPWSSRLEVEARVSDSSHIKHVELLRNWARHRSYFAVRSDVSERQGGELLIKPTATLHAVLKLNATHFLAPGWSCMTHQKAPQDILVMSQLSLHRNNKISWPFCSSSCRKLGSDSCVQFVSQNALHYRHLDELLASLLAWICRAPLKTGNYKQVKIGKVRLNLISNCAFHGINLHWYSGVSYVWND